MSAGRPPRVLLTAVALAAAACATLADGTLFAPASRPASTYEKVLLEAEAGLVSQQVRLGFMLFFGEAAPFDPDAARRWFTTAAEAGDPVARLDLALMTALGIGGPPDRAQAEELFEASMVDPARPVWLVYGTLEDYVADACRLPRVEADAGERTYGTFCSGCHGVHGIAAFGGSPSFAFGERMEKSDSELLQTVLFGYDVMPGWSGKVADDQLFAALRYLRTLQDDFRLGVLRRQRPEPPWFFRFGPMSTDFGARPAEPALYYGESRDILAEVCPVT